MLQLHRLEFFFLKISTSSLNFKYILCSEYSVILNCPKLSPVKMFYENKRPK